MSLTKNGTQKYTEHPLSRTPISPPPKKNKSNYSRVSLPLTSPPLLSSRTRDVQKTYRLSRAGTNVVKHASFALKNPFLPGAPHSRQAVLGLDLVQCESQRLEGDLSVHQGGVAVPVRLIPFKARVIDHQRPSIPSPPNKKAEHEKKQVFERRVTAKIKYDPAARDG